MNTNSVEVILNSAVATIKAIAPILNQHEVPGIVVWDSNRAIDTLGEYVFGFGFSTEAAGEDMAEFAYHEKGARAVAVISAQDEWSEIISNAFIERFTKLGGTITLREKVAFEEKNFRTHILKLQEADSDAIYFPLYTQSIQSIVKQAREAGFAGSLLTGDVFGTSDVENLGKQAEGIIFTQVWLPDESFLQKYRKAYGSDSDPINLAFAGLGYDAVTLLEKVINDLQKENKTIDSTAIRDRLIGFSFDGIAVKVGIKAYTPLVDNSGC